MKRIFYFIISLLTLAAAPLWASVGKITVTKGEVVIERAGNVIVAKTGMKIEEKDTVKTKVSSSVQLLFNDGAIITVGPNSQMSIEEYALEANSTKGNRFNVAKGVFKALTGSIGKAAPEKFKLTTKSATIGIRGTRFYGLVSEEKSDNQPGEQFACLEGTIVVTPPSGDAIVVEQHYMTTGTNGIFTPAFKYQPSDLRRFEVHFSPLVTSVEQQEAQKAKEAKKEEPSKTEGVATELAADQEVSYEREGSRGYTNTLNDLTKDIDRTLDNAYRPFKNDLKDKVLPKL